MADQPARLEAATVRAEVGSNIVYRFANDAASAADIPTLSGEIPNLSKIILTIQQEGADKISFSTRIYQTTAAGIAGTSDQEIFLVQTDDPDEIYAVWQNVSGTAVDTGKRSLSAAAILAATQAASDAATAAQESAEDATARVARFLAPSSVEPVRRNNNQPLELGDQWPNSSNGLVYNWNGTTWVPLNESVQEFESRLLAPDGDKFIGGEKSIEAPPGFIAGRLNDALPNGYGLQSGANVHIVAGIDSLTAGAGGFSYVTHLSEMIRAKFGDAGPGFQHISGDNNNDNNYWGSATAKEVFNLPVDDVRRRMSFNFSGFTYELFDGTKQAAWGPARDWDSMRLFYLKQPGGGKFKVDHGNLNTGTYRYEVDTESATYSLAYVDIVKKPGGAVNILFLPGSAASPGVYGKVCVYGALVNRIVSGPTVIVTRQARGGHTVAQFADNLDAETQTQWFSYLNPTLYLMNGGTNDAGQPSPISPETLKSKFAAIFSRLPSSCKRVMIAPNMHTGDELNVMPSYRPAIRDFAIANGYGYINNAELLGTRARAITLGFMLDNTHINNSGSKAVAWGVAEYIGLPKTMIAAPVTPFVVTSEGGGPAVIQRQVQLTRKELSDLAPDTDHVIYDLGLIGGFPTAMLDLEVFSNRQNTLSVIKSQVNARLRGLLTGNNNFAEGADLVATTVYSSIPAGAANTFTITISLVQVGLPGATRVQIVARSSTLFNLVSTGQVVLIKNAFTGKAVYEN